MTKHKYITYLSDTTFVWRSRLNGKFVLRNLRKENMEVVKNTHNASKHKAVKHMTAK